MGAGLIQTDRSPSSYSHCFEVKVSVLKCTGTVNCNMLIKKNEYNDIAGLDLSCRLFGQQPALMESSENKSYSLDIEKILCSGYKLVVCRVEHHGNRSKKLFEHLLMKC